MIQPLTRRAYPARCPTLVIPQYLGNGERGVYRHRTATYQGCLFRQYSREHLSYLLLRELCAHGNVHGWRLCKERRKEGASVAYARTVSWVVNEWQVGNDIVVGVSRRHRLGSTGHGLGWQRLFYLLFCSLRLFVVGRTGHGDIDGGNFVTGCDRAL